jgi:hypothetical protein
MPTPERLLQIEKRRAIQKRLEELEQDGRLTPDDVVNEARNPDSPLHDQFEWDLERAAMNTWIRQARELITSVKVQILTQSVVLHVPRYLRDPDTDKSLQGYVAIPKLMTDKERAKRALLQEFERATQILSRAAEYAAALGFSGEIPRLMHQVSSLAERLRED